MHPYPTSESAKSTLLCAFGLGLNPFRSCLVLFDRILCPPSLTMAKPSGGSSSRFADAGRNRYDRIRQPIPPQRPMPLLWVRQKKMTQEHPSPTMEYALTFLHRALTLFLAQQRIIPCNLHIQPKTERPCLLLMLLVSLPCSSKRTPLSLLRSSQIGCLPMQRLVSWMRQDLGPPI
jgi:hypothetical protein